MGITAPDESMYVSMTDGNGNTVVTLLASTGAHKALEGQYAPDGSRYVTLTDSNGNLG